MNRLKSLSYRWQFVLRIAYLLNSIALIQLGLSLCVLGRPLDGQVLVLGVEVLGHDSCVRDSITASWWVRTWQLLFFDISYTRVVSSARYRCGVRPPLQSLSGPAAASNRVFPLGFLPRQTRAAVRPSVRHISPTIRRAIFARDGSLLVQKADIQ